MTPPPATPNNGEPVEGALDLAGQPTLAECAAAPPDATFGLASLSRRALGTLGREWLLHGHLFDRAGMPLYLSRSTRAEMQQLAIDEWMLASPVYSRRMQALLGFAGQGVSTVFKNIQLDIGAPHQFMNFRFRLDSPTAGEFWLDHCGALMDVEPMGEEFVVGMCHDIEDPTFDATASATDPHAAVRPVHRPPRVPSDRQPHCRWEVSIDPANPEARAHPRLAEMEASSIARLPLTSVRHAAPPVDDRGARDYSGRFDPDFVLEKLCAGTLMAVLAEIALQHHLLVRAYTMSLATRVGEAEAVAMAGRASIGLAAVTAGRIADRAGLRNNAGAAEAARLLQLHPALQPPAYIGARVNVIRAPKEGVRLGITDCPALRHPDPVGWAAVFEYAGVDLLAAIASSLRPGSVVKTAPTGPAEAFAFNIELGPPGAPKCEPPEAALVRISTGAEFPLVDP
jgi:hypothetical protein